LPDPDACARWHLTSADTDEQAEERGPPDANFGKPKTIPRWLRQKRQDFGHNIKRSIHIPVLLTRRQCIEGQSGDFFVNLHGCPLSQPNNGFIRQPLSCFTRLPSRQRFAMPHKRTTGKEKPRASKADSKTSANYLSSKQWLHLPEQARIKKTERHRLPASRD